MPVWIDGGPRRSRRARVTRAAIVTVVPALAIGGAVLEFQTQQPAQPTLVDESAPGGVAPGGAGGHGRGMSQLGAFQYAKQGWNAQQILNFYYPGTTLGTVHTGLPVTVQLTKQNRVDVVAPAGAVVGGQQVAPGQAVSIDGTTATVRAGCGGPVVATVPAPDGTVSPPTANQGVPVDQVFRFCGSNAGYRGRLAAKEGKVLNYVGIEDYVRSVVPVESSPGWADQGGTAALQAQAIAARSYALVRGAERGEEFDDTQASQVYGGVDREDPRTDAIVASTPGLVMAQNGKVFETEYGASRADDPAG
ncbi:SpoIID/LytB domain-containing protein [Tsukamurella sp. 1534]|uniref:SpoIID/LytB domain-containing protein n=1 Tax=Tsukamurella sp. 1534 TaxID=1151061 RepID=UPI0002EAC0F3|nr:SpoIID/LytB domain-containing protein [Tsukamurella sp. 1534]